MTDILDEIRSACADVAANARFVTVQEDRIGPYAASLKVEGFPPPRYDADLHYLGDSESTAAFVLALDSVNFGSGWFPVLAKRPGMSGYGTVAASLTERFRRHGPMSAPEMAAITQPEVSAIFGQDADGPAAALMADFTRALNDLGSWIGSDHGGRFLGPVENADRSAAALVTQVAEAMPLFRDVSIHDGRAVPLMKRGQLLCADLALAFGDAGPGRFEDRERLTIFADNLVPHVLRLDGVLRYDPALLDRIERGDLLEAGSAEEVEIRAVALHACEMIVAELARTGVPVTAARLDYLLWHRGQDPARKAHPRHRARSRFY